MRDKILVIAEKPSMSKDMAKVMCSNLKKNKDYWEGDKYIFTWAIGHLMELQSPSDYNPDWKVWRTTDLPFKIDEYKFIPKKRTKEQLNTIKKLSARDDVTCLINACDPDREGELIFRLIYSHIKSHKETKRVWVSSLDDKSIRNGFENIQPSVKYDGLYNEAKARSIADWIMGFNLTRLYTKQIGLDETFSVGRVQTPTLNFVYQREKEIEDFISETYYDLYGYFDSDSVTAKLDIDKNSKLNKRKMKFLLEDLLELKEAQITKYENETKNISAPLLFSLGDLQDTANSDFSYSAQKTLEIAQKLYEKKVTSYPRTDCGYIPEEQLPDFLHTLNKTEAQLKQKRFINNKKVTAHHGLIVLKLSPSGLSEEEQNIFNLIKMRCLMQFENNYKYEKTMVEISSLNGSSQHLFKTNGKKEIDKGWRQLLKTDEPGQTKDDIETAIPVNWKQDLIISINGGEIKEKNTKPLSHLNEKTLRKKMETTNIGRPSSQAGVMETLKKRGYIKLKGRQILITKKGKILIKVAHESLKTEATTYEMETALKAINDGDNTCEQYIQDIFDFTNKVITVEKKTDRASERMDIKQDSLVGICPKCGGNVYEKNKGYFCHNEDCTFAIWKTDFFWKKFGKKITTTQVSKLLSDGEVKVKGWKSEKKNKKFDAKIKMVMQPNSKYNFKWEFEF